MTKGNWYRIDFQTQPATKTYIFIDHDYHDRPFDRIKQVEPLVYEWQCSPVSQSEAWDWLKEQFEEISRVLKINGGMCNLKFTGNVDSNALRWYVGTGLLREQVAEHEDGASTLHSLPSYKRVA